MGTGFPLNSLNLESGQQQQQQQIRFVVAPSGAFGFHLAHAFGSAAPRSTPGNANEISIQLKVAGWAVGALFSRGQPNSSEAN